MSINRTRALHPHPGDPSSPAASIEVACGIDADGGVCARYVVDGDIERLVIPAPCAHGALNDRRKDYLWETTCFEMFLQEDGTRHYWEFNFSPSSQFAGYVFEDFRKSLGDNTEMTMISNSFERQADRATQEVRLVSSELARAPGTKWRIGMTAIMETIKGEKSFWSLAHPLDAPEFHHADGFTWTVKAAVA